MITIRPVFVVIAALPLLGCSSTKYAAYEGGNVVEGTGGTRRTAQGIDIWENGTPPRKYRVIGIIDDVRHDALIPMADYESMLVKTARDAGGDAIIIMDAHSEIRGYSHSGGGGSAFTSGTATTVGNSTYYQGQTTYNSSGSTTRALRNKVTKAAVIKYAD